MKKKKLTKAEIAKIDESLLGWYTIGWGVRPDRVSAKDVINLIKGVAAAAHMTWYHSMRTGRAPGEDVSPAEGFMLLAYLVEHLEKTAKLGSVKTTALSQYVKKKDKRMGELYKMLQEHLNRIVPGYIEVPEHGDE